MPFPYRILLVDDEPAIRTSSEVLLKSKGYEVRTAADGFAALVELSRALPDVLISDLSMPNMSGFEPLSGAATISSNRGHRHEWGILRRGTCASYC